MRITSRGTAVRFVVPARVWALLACGLAGCLLAGCGGSRAATTTDAAKVRLAETHWRSGIVRWRHDMLRALDGISLIFSTTATLSDVNVPRSHTYVVLARYEGTLAGCASAIRQLGPVPQAFRVSGRYALKACVMLEQGERLVETAVQNLRHHSSANPLRDASVVLGIGQSDLGVAVSALKIPST